MYKKIVVFYITSICFITLFVYGIMQIMPNNPAKNLPFAQGLKIHDWFPQGWGFYSKDPRDLTFEIIDLKSGKQVVQWPNNRKENGFGLSRKGRSQGIEAGRLITNIDDTNWKNTENDPIKELKKMKSITVKNDSPNPTIKGDIGFIYQEPIPWSWAKNQSLIMPSKIVRLTVK